MKKNLLFAIMAIIMGLVTSSCETKEVTNYPETLIGFWASTADAENNWYGLEVTDATNAKLLTYEMTEVITEEAMTLTYTNTTGKGQLVGNGITLQLQASNDTTITINMVGGIVTLTRSQKPEEQFSIVGYWKEETTSSFATHLLVYPQDDQDTTFVTIITENKDDNMLEGTMGYIKSYDNATNTGTISYVGDDTKAFAITSIDMRHLSFTFGAEKTLTKQARMTNALKNIHGTWKTESNILGFAGAKMTVVVDENNYCDITYSMNDKTGHATGTVHYCPYAGMGVLVPIDYDISDELAELLEGLECGIFTILSDTQISVSLSSVGWMEELIFTKQ